MKKKSYGRNYRHRGAKAEAKHSEDAEKPLRAALYSRVSTEEQAQEGFSLDAQMDRLEAYVKSREWTEAGRYVDPGATGRDTKRQEYQAMIADIDKWDVIVVVKMDRIHRSQRNFIEMMDQLGAKGRDFVSITEALDTSNAMGRFVQSIIQGIAQLESEVIAERTLAGMVQKSKTDHVLGQHAPYGYRWTQAICPKCQAKTEVLTWIQDRYFCVQCGEDITDRFKYGTGEWVQVEEEAAIVLEIFTLYASQVDKLGPVSKRPGATNKWSMHRITEKIGWCGCKPGGKYQGDCTGSKRTAYILNNPSYVGYYVFDGEIYKGKHRPIISRELFQRAQTRRRKYRVVLPPEET